MFPTTSSVFTSDASLATSTAYGSTTVTTTIIIPPITTSVFSFSNEVYTIIGPGTVMVQVSIVPPLLTLTATEGNIAYPVFPPPASSELPTTTFSISTLRSEISGTSGSDSPQCTSGCGSWCTSNCGNDDNGDDTNRGNNRCHQLFDCSGGESTGLHTLPSTQAAFDTY